MRKHRGKERQNKISKLWSCPQAMKKSIEVISPKLDLENQDKQGLLTLRWFAVAGMALPPPLFFLCLSRYVDSSPTYPLFCWSYGEAWKTWMQSAFRVVLKRIEIFRSLRGWYSLLHLGVSSRSCLPLSWTSVFDYTMACVVLSFLAVSGDVSRREAQFHSVTASLDLLHPNIRACCSAVFDRRVSILLGCRCSSPPT
ncbi:hypothetical protein IGI04_026396 [Brassica rapa subsp. trilocularis]|uniref:Uncharacterized protein n=1 Tax=Brassica rapa subsp. trilocularis TaxID=1813537 RepID=A0ABQ7KZ02_BRACM|nr:hypothetical protein IGI04_026396 [Brassica rapa subsp. trilocularis]